MRTVNHSIQCAKFNTILNSLMDPIQQGIEDGAKLDTLDGMLDGSLDGINEEIEDSVKLSMLDGMLDGSLDEINKGVEDGTKLGSIRDGEDNSDGDIEIEVFEGANEPKISWFSTVVTGTPNSIIFSFKLDFLLFMTLA